MAIFYYKTIKYNILLMLFKGHKLKNKIYNKISKNMRTNVLFIFNLTGQIYKKNYIKI